MYELIGKEFKLTDNVENSQSKTIFFTSYNQIYVSTVFLGWDHSLGASKPILFETMVFGGQYNEYQVRYHSYDEAEAGHNEVCDMIKNDPEVMEFVRNQKILKLLK